jgi:hypothetical protein
MEAKFREILKNLEEKKDLSPELEQELLAKIKGGVETANTADNLTTVAAAGGVT